LVLIAMSVNVRLNQNVTIFHRVQTGMVYDPDKGHDIPTYTEENVAAYLNPNPFSPRDLQPPQVENSTIQFVTGNCDRNLNPTQKLVVEAEMNGCKGRLHLEATGQHSATHRYNYSRLTGYPIKGWFQVGGKIN
jgi:hypothetical protein